MHRHGPFCCTSSVPDQTSSSIISLPPASTPKPDSATRSDNTPPPLRSANHLHNHHRPGDASAPSAELKMNVFMCNGMCGALYKWANYGKGWRPRWFVLQDGVLSYYKFHGPNKIVVIPDTEKGSKVIGDFSNRILNKSISNRQSKQVPRGPVGEIHLEVSSIHESRSDDKKFSIYTGTKRMHLRAESREDRGTWLEALKIVKKMFPRISNSELMAPIDNLAVLIDKLRQQLQEEGVREEAIQDSEEIMRNEYASMYNQLLLLKHKQWVLMDTLRELEVYNMSIRKHHARRNSSSVSPTILRSTKRQNDI